METVEQNEGAVQVRGDLRISDAETLRSRFAGELMVTRTLVLDLSQVGNCDTASIQLLCSLKKSAERANKSFSISGSTSAILEVSATLGIRLADLSSIPK